jgi:hypothetical protein
MASGKFGNAAPAPGVLTLLYAGPSPGWVSKVSVIFVNGGSVAAAIRLAISLSPNPAGVADADYVSRGFTLQPGDEFEKTDLLMGHDEYLWVFATQPGVSVRAHGFEEPT